MVRPDRRHLAHLALMLAGGDIALPAARAYPLEQLAEALDRVRAGTNGAPVVLTV